jgi:hypothetical protein
MNDTVVVIRKLTSNAIELNLQAKVPESAVYLGRNKKTNFREYAIGNKIEIEKFIATKSEAYEKNR